MKKRILVVDDEHKMRRNAEIYFEKMGYGCLKAESAEQALEILSNKRVDLVLTDLRMPGLSGIDLLTEMRRRGQRTPVVIMTAYGDVKDAVEAMKRGAGDFLLKPFDFDSMEIAVNRVLDHEEVKRENVFLKEELKQEREAVPIIGESEKTREIFSLIERVAPTDASVLLCGETGTGKELFARLIHEKSPRRDRMFVAVNCAAIPEALLESELFGHTKGAFTGANAERTGRFERAEGGSIFFDEVGDMDPFLQAKILRVLQEREFEKVGGAETLSVDVRVIAATNRDLKKMIAGGIFRQDLYYRLNVVTIDVPPLRDRPGDIAPIVKYFTEKYSREWGKEVAPPGEDVVDVLRAYSWPGNVREVQNVMERAVALGCTDRIELDDLPSEIVKGEGVAQAAAPAAGGEALPDLDGAVSGLERRLIGRALREADGIKARAAKLLGISQRNLWYKLKKYKMEGK